MKKRIFELLFIVAMIITIIGMLSFIVFYYVGSYDMYDESVGMKYCEVIADKSGSEVNTVLNDFMYNSDKYYSCVIGDTIPLVYIIDSEGEVTLYKNYTKYKEVADKLDGKVSYGLYEDKIVVVEKIIRKDSLDIYYYDEQGNLIFDLKGMDSNE